MQHPDAAVFMFCTLLLTCITYAVVFEGLTCADIQCYAYSVLISFIMALGFGTTILFANDRIADDMQAIAHDE